MSVCPTFEALFVHTLFLSLGQSFCVKVYKTSYFEDPLMDFIHIWHDGIYRSKVFISTMLVSLILSMMVYIRLEFFSAPSPSWGMAFKSRSQTFHTNVSFAYIIKTD